MILARVPIGEFEQFWRTFSKAGKDKRAEHGCRGVRVYRNAEDPGEVINLFDWDREGWDSFMADPEVPEIMRSAGLRSRPQATFLEAVEELDA